MPLWLPLSLCAPLISLSFSLPLPLSFPCAVAWGVVIFGMFSLHCALSVCVNCGHPWGRGERWGGPVREQPCQVLWYDSAWSYRHLVCLKGKRKVDLPLPPFALPLLSIRPLSLSFSVSLSLSHTLCSPRALRKQLLYSLRTSIPPYQPNLSHQSWHTTHRCLDGCKCVRKEEIYNFVGQWLWNNLFRRTEATVPADNAS